MNQAFIAVLGRWSLCQRRASDSQQADDARTTEVELKRRRNDQSPPDLAEIRPVLRCQCGDISAQERIECI